MTLDDLKDNLFVQHDLNLFNFVIYLNRALQDRRARGVETAPRLDLSMVNPVPGAFGRHAAWQAANFIDLQTAIEIFTPTYQLLLTDNDFWRASNSLQLDEIIGHLLRQAHRPARAPGAAQQQAPPGAGEHAAGRGTGWCCTDCRRRCSMGCCCS